MKRLLALSALFLVALAQADLTPDTVAKIEAAVAAEMKAKSITGISIAIGRGTGLQYAKGFGLRDLENGLPVTPDTLFRTASIAKSVTAVAVMQLSETGKLDLEKKIQEYVPEYPEKKWPVNCRQILGHISGVRHYKTGEEATGKQYYPTLLGSLDLFKADDLLFEPETKYSYSTFSYTLLGIAVERASGTSFREYLQKNIFAAADMNRSRFDDHYLIIPNRSRGYFRLSESAWKQLPSELQAIVKTGDHMNADLHDTSMKVPGGGILSTPSDLVKFGFAMIDAKLVKPQTREKMWTKGKLKDGTETAYGLGWNVGTVAGTRRISHSGSQAGTSTLLYILPDKRISIAIMCNLEDTALGELMQAIGKIVLES